MRVDLERRLRDRRVNSGPDTRSAEVRELLGERRRSPDRRSDLGRLSGQQLGRRSSFSYIVLVAGVIFVDIYFFDGRHSTDIVETMARDLNWSTIRWIAPAFSGG
jgi:hypothetical protein